MAKQRAASIATELKGAKDFAAAVKRAGLEDQATELIARGSAIPDLDQRIDRQRRVHLPQGWRQRRDHHADRHRHHPRGRKVNITDAEIESGKDQCAMSW
jgi:hypothetical protein